MFERVIETGPQIWGKNTNRAKQSEQQPNIGCAKRLMLKVQTPERHDAADQGKIEAVEAGQTPIRHRHILFSLAFDICLSINNRSFTHYIGVLAAVA